MYDYIIVGSGLYGAVCANELKKKGFSVLVLERREHIGGNIYTEEVEGIQVHKYGAHIFHTNDKEVWLYLNDLVEFNRFTNSPLANYKGEIYNLPFNMNTFYKLWGQSDPGKVKEIIDTQRKKHIKEHPENLEEKALSLVGSDVYEMFIKGYTEKQWGRSAKDLPAFIIQRIPVRLTYDNNYFNDKYQGIPTEGYTKLIEKMLCGTQIELGVDYLLNRDKYNAMASRKIIYTGSIDSFFGYKYGALEYRSLRFDSEILDCQNYQGNAVVNYTDSSTPYTRILEHKHFYPDLTAVKTVITKEYPKEWVVGDEAYYPINDAVNMDLLKKYQEEAKKEDGIIFGGRLAEYKYYDMHIVVRAALNKIRSIFEAES